MNETKSTTLLKALYFSLFLLLIGGYVRADEPTVKIISTNVICRQSDRYIGWPTIARTHNGDLLVVFSGDRDGHICPWGKTQMIRSSDKGNTWTTPLTINDTPLDDRDAGIIETYKNTLIVSWFTSLAFLEPGRVSSIPETKRNEWRHHIEELDHETRENWLGYWIRRSEDNGKTWGVPIQNHVTAPHGPIQLSDKRLLYVGMGTKDGSAVIGVEESRNDGLSWNLIAVVPIPSDEEVAHYHEPHVVEMEKGETRGIVQVRTKGQVPVSSEAVGKHGRRKILVDCPQDPHIGISPPSDPVEERMAGCSIWQENPPIQ